MTRPSGSLLLRFAEGADADSLRGQLSAVVHAKGHLWLASDESASIERLSRTGAGEYGGHRAFRLADHLDLPADEDEEVDIEGMDFADGFLWLVGSHSLKRRKPKPGREAHKQIRRLAELRADGNRYLIARLPLVNSDEGEVVPGRSHDRGGPPPGAARLMGTDRGNLLTEVLRMDEHLRPFLEIPGKDNGFDVEGIAAHGDRVYLGLRGPVLRGWAVVLEIRLEDAGPGLLRLGAIEGSARPYRKHFLDLRGLGVRDLCFHGSDLLVLAGPTMDLDGPAAVYRWRHPRRAAEDALLHRDELEEVVSVPYGTGEHDARDHPEGLALYAAGGGEPDQLLVVYDSPDAHRVHGPGAVRADLFPLE